MVSLFVISLQCFSCSSYKPSSTTPPPISVSVAPASAPVTVNQMKQFTATVTYDSQNMGVTWSLSCTGSCGLLSPSSTANPITYTAPANVPNPATVTLTAKSNADTTKTASATITVTSTPPPISVTVSPTSANVQVNQTANFTATVQNDTQNQGVTWTLSGAGCSGSTCGTLSSTSSASGTPVTYTAPASIPTTSTVTLTAKSISDTTKIASATITVTSATQAATPVFINGQRQVSTFLGRGTGAVTAGCDNNAENPSGNYLFCLADASSARNAIIAACVWSTAGVGSVTMTDDGGNAYTPMFATPPNDTSRTIQVWLAANAAAGVHQLTLAFATKPTGIQCGAYQFANVATASPNCGTTFASGTGTSVAARSFMPVANNCLIFQLGVTDLAPSGRWTAMSSPVFTLQDASPREGFAVQTFVQATAAAVNPTLTMSSSNGWVTAAVALKSASSGSAPTGMYVQRTAQNALVDGNSSYTFQFPCSGNLVVVAFNGNTGEQLTLVTGTNPTSNYTQIGSGVVGGEGIQQIWRSPDNIACTQNHTITISGTTITLGDVMFYDVTGAAAASPSDSTLATDSGNQSPFGPLNTASVTPSSSDGILFCTIGIALNGSISFNPTGYQDNQDENNGWGHFHYTSTIPITTSWGTDNRQGSGGVGYYSDACAAFKSATAH